MILIGLVDSDVQERLKLKEYIKSYFDKKEEFCVIHQFSDGVEFIQSKEKYNIVFLEIKIGEMDGIEVARFFRMVNKEAQIVFVTHTEQMAIRGYEVDAASYMLKPINETSIHTILDKIAERLKESMDMILVLKTPDGLCRISSSEIKFIEVYDHDLIYHTERGEITVRGNLSNVYKKLKKYQFIQCNRSYLVNMRYINGIHKNYVLVEGIQIQIAKSRQKEIEQRFVDYVGICI